MVSKKKTSDLQLPGGSWEEDEPPSPPERSP